MIEMFSSCELLTTVDLSSFIISEFSKKNLPFKSINDLHELHEFINHKIISVIKEKIKSDTLFKTFLFGMFNFCPNIKNVITDDINIINEFKNKY